MNEKEEARECRAVKGGVTGSNGEDEHQRARDMQGGWQVWANKKKRVSATWGKGVAGSNEEEEHTRGPDMQGGWQIWAKKKKRMSAEQGKVGCWFQRKL